MISHCISSCLVLRASQDNKDKHCKKLYDINEVDSRDPQPISALHAHVTTCIALTTHLVVCAGGLRIEMFPHRAESEPDKFFVMAATPNRNYQFIG